MISMTTLSVQPLPVWRTPLRDPRAPAQEPSPGFGLPSLMEMRDAQKSMKKEMAAKRVQAVRERRDALMLMVGIDPRAGLKMTAELAKELKSAVKDYVEAGGRNVTDGEMAMMGRDAKDARKVADEAFDGLPAEPKDIGIEAETARADAEMKRGQAAYAAAFGIADWRDATADRAEAVLGAAMTDRGFFEQVKMAVAELKEAREKIKADWAHLKAPNKDDWKAADRELAELEKAIDMAPTGAPDPAASGASVKA
ncbi:hypothetical protein [Brevundimonas sp. R86498]|uniref:hypothetical protein n=1 Tax=Brevundimonas sp. R86498 TaxID=3093845 RepID=UPI0037C68265